MDMPNTLLQLHGLKALARRHNDALEEIAKAAMELTGEKDDGGHCADFAYDNSVSPETLWERTAFARDIK